ncbi:hypothetical protein [Bifidobacterium sp. SO1]|uniref:hypothetical protein n=1 Tax=Bifidobacterium sp. SO1 TaxID=2809029 RepID=UPI001BDDC826|nr:hypothetical protein [Bifidobacterium sp. SO1]MBT1161464.1 hypothetical protein [Bifidobacterium sp. SO1]
MMNGATVNDDAVKRALSEFGFTVLAVEKLCKITGWSVEYACRRLAPYAPAQGVFVLMDANGSVDRAVPLLGFAPPKRNSNQSEMSIYHAARNNRHNVRTIMRDDVQVKYSTGSYSQRLYAQAVVANSDLLVVLALTDHAPWMRGDSPAQRGSGAHRPGTMWELTCKKCGGVHYVVGDTYCKKCGHLRCPKGHCWCVPARTRMCPQCFLERNENEFLNGSDICRWCEE